MHQTQDELLREQSCNEALNRTVEPFSARSNQPRSIRMDLPEFDGTAPHTIVHWILAMEQCGVAQIFEDDTRMVSYAMPNLRGKASDWAYSALMANKNRPRHGRSLKQKFAPCISRQTIKFYFRRVFGARQAKRSLQEYAQGMRSLSASITSVPIPGHTKVPTFMNGLRHGPSRQALFRKVPRTMEEAIKIAMVELQS